MSVRGKNILIGITGGIAAYKIHWVVRELIKQGASVKIILTPNAHDFVTPLSLSTLSKNPVFTDFYDENGTWNNHVALAEWADVFLIAPCTASTMAKMTIGQADNLLLATYLSAKSTVFIAPAMDLDMYAHPTTQQNLKQLESWGVKIIPAEEGELASGLSGKGRMAEPEMICEALNSYFESEIKSPLKHKKILITAGPTYESLDPVRFIGNHSSGKMGFALAEEAAARGMEVILISGPTQQHLQNPKIKRIDINSAKEMYNEVFQYFKDVDIAIMSAAVADYAPKNFSKNKIKKKEDSLTIELVKNPDILRKMGEEKKNQFLVGFALETNNEEENAQKKLKEKNLDFIVLNSLQDEGAGFRGKTNKITIFAQDGTATRFQLKSKSEVAKDILNTIESKIGK